MIITKEQQQTLVDIYIEEKHNTDECIGFIDGINAALNLAKKLDNQNGVGVLPSGMIDKIFDLTQKATKEFDKNYGEYSGGTQIAMHSLLEYILQTVRTQQKNEKMPSPPAPPLDRAGHL